LFFRQKHRRPRNGDSHLQRLSRRSVPPRTEALGDWIHNNSTTAMIIVAAIIAFVVLIVALLEFAVI
jgi:hypothetical protein